jgi:hypothetical protein
MDLGKMLRLYTSVEQYHLKKRFLRMGGAWRERGMGEQQNISFTR